MNSDNNVLLSHHIGILKQYYIIIKNNKQQQMIKIEEQNWEEMSVKQWMQMP